MPRLTDAARDARRNQITAAARQCFERQGFAGTSMADISAASGLSAGSIYSHFESKDQILRQTAERIFRSAETTLTEAAAATGRLVTPREAATTLAEQVLSRDLIRMFLQFWAEAPVNPALAELVRGNLHRALEMMVGVLRPWALSVTGDEQAAEALAHSRANGIMALMHGYFIRICVEPEADAQALLRDLIGLLPGPEATDAQDGARDEP